MLFILAKNLELHIMTLRGDADMIHAVCSIVSIFLVIIGVVEVARIAVLMILQTKKDEGMMILVPIRGHDEEAEYLLRSAAAKVKWFNTMRDQKVICLDCGMDEETRKVCTLIADNYRFMEIYDMKEFEEDLMKSRE